MRIICRHGHFAFYPEHAGDLSRFVSYYGIALARDPDEDFYTFPLLVGAPNYSLVGKAYLGLAAIATFGGRHSWDVLRANGFVYSLTSKGLVPKASIMINVNPPLVGYYYLGQSQLVQPGSLNVNGQRIISYDAELLQDYNELRISEFEYE